MSAKMQLKLVKMLEEMSHYCGCQFIIATHSPFLLAMDNTKIYDLDSIPIEIKIGGSLKTQGFTMNFQKHRNLLKIIFKERTKAMKNDYNEDEFDFDDEVYEGLTQDKIYLNEGADAYQRGDYETAIRLYKNQPIWEILPHSAISATATITAEVFLLTKIKQESVGKRRLFSEILRLFISLAICIDTATCHKILIFHTHSTNEHLYWQPTTAKIIM